MAKIYVSYTTRDREIASRIVEGLRTRGHSVMWDVDVLRVGHDWRVVLAQALRECTVLVSVLTRNSVSASYAMSELGAARVLGKAIVPIICDDIDYPNIVQDLFCIRAQSEELEPVLDRISGDLLQIVTENKKIFIVHGQNEAKKLELKDFLAKLALDPVILHQQNDLGKTIIEKFEYYAAQCAFAFVLLTPDDQVAPADASPEIKWRARQNVILELGWFMAKLGRERVMILHQGKLELPTDILGVVYAPFKDNVVEVGESIRERLKGVGLLA